MNGRLQDYRLLWGAAVSHGNPFGSTIVRFGLPFLVLVAAASQWQKHGVGAALAWGWGVVCCALLMVWAYRFVPGAVRLNAPAQAKLLPRARRRLIELFCLVWLVALTGLVLLSLLGDGASLFLPFCVGLSLASALAVTGHPAGTPVMIAFFFATVLAGRLPPTAQAPLSHPAAVVVAVALSAGLLALTARLVFPEAGERHWRMDARRARMADTAANPAASSAANPGALREKFPGLRSRRWYAATLRRDSRRGASRRLVLHALGNTHHVDELALGLGLLSVVVFVLGTFIGWHAGDEVMEGIGWLIACSLLAVPFATTLRLAQLLPLYANEQALVRLAPAMPSTAPAFNRHLAQALLLHCLKGWGLAAAAALGVAALAGTGAGKLVHLACVCCLLLPMVAAPLRDYAARSASSPLVPILLLLASIGASLAFGFAANALSGVQVLPVASVVSIGLAMLAILRGLRVMERAPCAFPAARMD